MLKYCQICPQLILDIVKRPMTHEKINIESLKTIPQSVSVVYSLDIAQNVQMSKNNWFKKDLLFFCITGIIATTRENFFPNFA